MSEKQPAAYVICRYSIAADGSVGDNIPVKVFDTRREARAYCTAMNERARKYGYIWFKVKQG